MATPLFDVSLIKFFSPIFSLIFVFAFTYAVLELTNLFKNKGLHSIIALMMALMTAVTPQVLDVITGITPWFVLMAVLFMFVLMIGIFLGVQQADIVSVLGGKSAIWWVLISGIIIIISVLGQVYGQQALSITQDGSGDTTTTVSDGSSGTGTTGTSDLGTNVGKTLFHPKVLGMILILLIASFAIRFLSMAN